MMPNDLRALVIQHEQSAPAGYIGKWLNGLGARQDVMRIDLAPRRAEVREYGLIVSLGCALAAYDDSIPWLGHERRLLHEAAAAEVPILGVCFGGQLLARVLGGQALSSDRPEIGWLPVHSSDPALVPEGPWFQWHFDRFLAPPGARVIAHSAGRAQAFMIGRSLGVQFHPEVTPTIVERWIAESPHELERERVDRDLLRAQTRDREAQSREAAWTLFDAFLERVAGVSESRTR